MRHYICVISRSHSERSENEYQAVTSSDVAAGSAGQFHPSNFKNRYLCALQCSAKRERHMRFTSLHIVARVAITSQ